MNSDKNIQKETIQLFLINEAALCVATLVLSIIRAEYIGYSTRDFVQIALVVSLVLLAAFSPRLQLNQTAIGLIVINFLIFNSGFLGLGPMAGAVFFLPLAIFVISVIFSRRALYLSLGLSAMYIVGIAFAFYSQTLTPRTELNQLFLNPYYWLVYLFCLMLSMAVSSIALLNYREKINGLLSDLNQQKEEIEWHALHDELTGLMNLKAFKAQFEHHTAGALLFIDLDGFKAVNDKFGHESGDYCLQTVAKRMSTILRQDVQVCRLGGDEFLVYLKSDSKSEIEELSRQLLTLICEPIQQDNIAFQVSASIGALIFSGTNHKLKELVKLADQAMYRAKTKGKCCIEFSSIATN